MLTFHNLSEQIRFNGCRASRAEAVAEMTLRGVPQEMIDQVMEDAEVFYNPMHDAVGRFAPKEGADEGGGGGGSGKKHPKDMTDSELIAEHKEASAKESALAKKKQGLTHEEQQRKADVWNEWVVRNMAKKAKAKEEAKAAKKAAKEEAAKEPPPRGPEVMHNGEKRETWPDGRLVPKVGEKVFQMVPGFGGSPAVIQGEVYQGKGKNKELRVRITGSHSMLGVGSAPKGKTYAIHPAWSVMGDPELARRKEAKEKKAKEEKDASDKAKAAADAKLKEAHDKHGVLKPGDVKVGDVLEDILNGTKMHVKELDKQGGAYGHVLGEQTDHAPGYLGHLHLYKPAGHQPISSKLRGDQGESPPVLLHHTYKSKHGGPHLDVPQGVFALSHSDYPDVMPNEYGDKVAALTIAPTAKVYTAGEQADAIEQLFTGSAREKYLADYDDPDPAKMRQLDSAIAGELRQRGFDLIHYKDTDQYGSEWAVINKNVIVSHEPDAVQAKEKKMHAASMSEARRRELLGASMFGRHVLFTEDQPRDDHGRWTDTGGGDAPKKDETLNEMRSRHREEWAAHTAKGEQLRSDAIKAKTKAKGPKAKQAVDEQYVKDKEAHDASGQELLKKNREQQEAHPERTAEKAKIAEAAKQYKEKSDAITTKAKSEEDDRNRAKIEQMGGRDKVLADLHKELGEANKAHKLTKESNKWKSQSRIDSVTRNIAEVERLTKPS